MPQALVLLAIVAAAACSGPTTVPDPIAQRCATASELACIDSPECTLVLATAQPPGGYTCRVAIGPCETGFRQRSDTRDSCEAKPGCAFQPGMCYCAPDVTCICGGGPPPQCVEGAG